MSTQGRGAPGRSCALRHRRTRRPSGQRVNRTEIGRCPATEPWAPVLLGARGFHTSSPHAPLLTSPFWGHLCLDLFQKYPEMLLVQLIYLIPLVYSCCLEFFFSY
uniref:Uncharacterized protein n=1 Tax=Macaca mulatta TaxID=9544 RepID=A0A5F8AV27_MACMU